MNRPLTLLTLTGPLVCFFALTTLGDEFELDDGRRIQGAIVREIGELVSIKTTDGDVITIRKSRIKSQRSTKTAIGEYLKRKEEIDDRSIDDHLQLAKWCEGKGLDSKRTFHLKRVITLNPGHTGARNALGFVLIGGDWYKKGSPEAEKRTRQLEKPLDSPAKEIPDAPVMRRPERPTTKVKPKVNSTSVHYRFDEKLSGSAPDVSLAYYRIQDLMRSMKDPMHFVETKADTSIVDGYLMELKVRAYFVGVNKFYTKAISNRYRGEAQFTLYRMDAGKKTKVATLPKIEVGFTASLDLPKEKAYGYAYYDTVHTLLEKLSRNKFFAKRGAKPYTFGE